MSKAKRKAKTRKTVAEIRLEAVNAARNDIIAEVCQVLKWHCGYALVADQLWEAMLSGQKLRRGPYYDDPRSSWVTVPPLKVN